MARDLHRASLRKTGATRKKGPDLSANTQGPPLGPRHELVLQRGSVAPMLLRELQVHGPHHGFSSDMCQEGKAIEVWRQGGLQLEPLSVVASGFQALWTLPSHL